MPADGSARGERDTGRRVLVTGIGMVSALGLGGGAALCAALESGHVGIGPVQAFSTETCGSHLAAEVPDLAGHLDGQEMRRLARISQFAVLACRLALADGGLDPSGVPSLGLVLGSEHGDFRSSQTFARGYLERGPLGLSPLTFPNAVMNVMAAQAAIAVGARGPMLTVNQRAIAGELAVARGAAFIATGRAEAVLAGGVDELCPILYHELARLGMTSLHAPGPEGCRPFDRRANGTVLGEGATVVLLEAAAHAHGRRARVYAELAGAAWGSLPAPAHGVPSPRRRDPAVVHRALAASAVGATGVDVGYLTGAGDAEQDTCELDLVARAFDGVGGRMPRLTALTPLVGAHAGLGGLRVAAAAMSLVGAGIPGLPDLPDPVREGLPFAVGSGTHAMRARTALVHGLARGGGHAALVLTESRHPEAA